MIERERERKKRVKVKHYQFLLLMYMHIRTHIIRVTIVRSIYPPTHLEINGND